MAAPRGLVPAYGGCAATPEGFVPVCAPVVPTRGARGWLRAAQEIVLTGILARGKVLERNKGQKKKKGVWGTGSRRVSEGSSSGRSDI